MRSLKAHGLRPGFVVSSNREFLIGFGPGHQRRSSAIPAKPTLYVLTRERAKSPAGHKAENAPTLAPGPSLKVWEIDPARKNQPLKNKTYEGAVRRRYFRQSLRFQRGLQSPPFPGKPTLIGALHYREK
jgi:hypothetical protein